MSAAPAPPTRWTLDAMPPQAGRVHVVTGANAGLGLECARALAARGAHVVLACRNTARAAAHAAALRNAHPGSTLEVEALDLGDLASVRACAERLCLRLPRVDVLMLNAGLMAGAGERTADGFERSFGVNHLGHFALAGRLLPVVRATPGARVVSVSSLYHWIGRFRAGDDPGRATHRDRGRAYADSKLANLLFTLEFDRRARAADLTLVAAAAHPGYAATEFQRRAAAVARAPLRSALSALSVRLFAQSAARGALPLLRAATDPAVRGGDYLGPDGAREVRGAGTAPAALSARARDPEAARALWTYSVGLTGVDFGRL